MPIGSGFAVMQLGCQDGAGWCQFERGLTAKCTLQEPAEEEEQEEDGCFPVEP